MVEDHILHTTAGLVNRSNMDELWEMAVTKIVGELHKSSVSDSYWISFLKLSNTVRCHLWVLLNNMCVKIDLFSNVLKCLCVERQNDSVR